VTDRDLHFVDFALKEGIDVKRIFSFGGLLNMTYVALNLSRYVNGVAKKPCEVSRLMFTGYSIAAIANGVHAATWAAKPFQELYDRHIPGWREDNSSLRHALSIPRQEVWEAHALAKKELIQHVNRKTGTGMDAEILTFGFARRSTTYKRGELFFQDSVKSKEGIPELPDGK
jgi:glycogen phosphorylase